jgi:hypothetical protein
VQARA